MENWSEVVSSNLKKWREAYGWSQEILAEKAGCSKSVIRDLEAQSRGASMEMLSKICEAFKIDLRTLFSVDKPFISNFSQPDFDKVAENASVLSLVNILGKKLGNIPDDVLDFGTLFNVDDEVWEDVRAALSHHMRKKGREAQAKKNA